MESFEHLSLSRDHLSISHSATGKSDQQKRNLDELHHQFCHLWVRLAMDWRDGRTTAAKDLVIVCE